MPLFIRKLLYPVLLNCIAGSSLVGQAVIHQIIPIAGMFMNNMKPVKLLKPYKFDSTDMIIGIDLSGKPTGRYGKFCFILDNVRDLNDLNDSLVFDKEGDMASDQDVFKIYYIRNKTIKNSWNVLPGLNSIVANDGVHYLFDTSVLADLHWGYPLSYDTRFDTVRSKSDFFRFNDRARKNPDFLFLTEPDMSYEGSFDVKVKAGSTISPDAVGERIIKIYGKIAAKTSVGVYLKADDKTGDAAQTTYVVRCNQSLFDHFSDPHMNKGGWSPATYLIRSFWRN